MIHSSILLLYYIHKPLESKKKMTGITGFPSPVCAKLCVRSRDTDLRFPAISLQMKV